jgi:bifunctional DNA-binding transcriptional regulator/antitoxin component of YhaV-PrlF toxin-antitoxin module
VTKTTNSNVRYEVITQEGDDGDLIIPLPMPLLKSLGWKEGDDVTISIDEKGNLFLKKADK